MTKDEINRTIAEAMGLCWHEWRFVQYSEFKDVNWICTKCGVKILWDNDKELPDFTTPVGFFGTWNWAKEQEWWPRFMSYPRGVGMARTPGAFVDKWAVDVDLIDPQVFAAALATYIKEVLNG